MAVTYDEIVAEIGTHTALLAGWLAGEAADADIDTFAAAHDPGFSMVDTIGEIVALPDVVDGITAARGAVPGLHIDVQDVEILTRSDQAVLVRYLETHRLGEDRAPRRVTAALRPDQAAAGGFRWLHLHETPLPRD
ncbi:hypothetical protein GIY23_14780 [Allosaccharopolyspora coralli]|uniref:SnoaL-like domain-containing protein n=1 Tax=Allosaccharopolyspora coralli TaxID=2665642 RepID=A0A5Q3QGL9_9PSEU|nr:nuclear transport factor 2 family protein [Allosaccharopolyspora coralli]QGK70609.1 hypothetical protein GIY23_14780 [Allosaccharopolyspora coralli]